MLEPADRPNPTDLTEIESDALALDGEPWEIVGLESVLRGFANSLPDAGDTGPRLNMPEDQPKNQSSNSLRR